MADTKIKASGACQCGNVTVSVNGPALRMAQCHCRDCQKASGTGHMSLVFMKQEDVEMSGDTKSYDCTTDSGNTSSRLFCPNCGSRVGGTNTGRPGLIGLPIGLFDDRSWFDPGAVVYSRTRDEWDITSTDIPNFETMPPPA